MCEPGSPVLRKVDVRGVLTRDDVSVKQKLRHTATIAHRGRCCHVQKKINSSKLLFNLCSALIIDHLESWVSHVDIRVLIRRRILPFYYVLFILALCGRPIVDDERGLQLKCVFTGSHFTWNNPALCCHPPLSHTCGQWTTITLRLRKVGSLPVSCW